jgi:hypothetical protein
MDLLVPRNSFLYEKKTTFSIHPCEVCTLYFSGLHLELTQYNTCHNYYSIYLSFLSCDSCRRLPEPKHHSFMFNQCSASKCLYFHGYLYTFHPRFSWTSSFSSYINYINNSCIQYHEQQTKWSHLHG